MAEAGARLAIRLLQDAAERGDIDPWDVDVIAVVDGFLDQLRQRIERPRRLDPQGGSYERDLAESSEAFLAASVLVGLKAELLESATFPPEPLLEVPFSAEDNEGWDPGALALPRRPERHLHRRPVAPPPLQRPVTLGELIRQLEDIAERLEQDGAEGRHRPRARRYSERAAIAQVASLAHREKLPETTAALSRFLLQWSPPPKASNGWPSMPWWTPGQQPSKAPRRTRTWTRTGSACSGPCCSSPPRARWNWSRPADFTVRSACVAGARTGPKR